MINQSFAGIFSELYFDNKSSNTYIWANILFNFFMTIPKKLGFWVPDPSLVVSSLNPKCRFQIVWRLLSFFPWDNDCYARFLYQLKKTDWVIFFSKCSSPFLWIFSRYICAETLQICILCIFWGLNYALFFE